MEFIPADPGMGAGVSDVVGAVGADVVGVGPGAVVGEGVFEPGVNTGGSGKAVAELLATGGGGKNGTGDCGLPGCAGCVGCALVAVGAVFELVAGPSDCPCAAGGVWFAGGGPSLAFAGFSAVSVWGCPCSPCSRGT